MKPKEDSANALETVAIFLVPKFLRLFGIGKCLFTT